MRYDILFHLTTPQNFKDHTVKGQYEPEILTEKGYIPCVGGHNIETIANKLFPDEQYIMLLVIDVPTLQSEVKYTQGNSGEKHPHIPGALNLDAVIDKIKIKSEDEGKFEISFKSYS